MAHAASRLLRPFLIAAVIGASVPAFAAPQRTFVASNGLDTNPCSLTAPCRGFEAAVAQVSVGGEVIVLDSAGYGPVTIVQSVSIIAPQGIYAGITVFSGDGVTINGSGINVLLRGLTLTGQGGVNGITITNAATVRIEGGAIANFSGTGIYHTAGTLSVEGTTIRNNAGIGVWSIGTVQATLNRTQMEENLDGVRAQNGAQVAVQESVMTHNANVGAFAFLSDATVTRFTRLSVSRSLMSFNQQGVQARSIVPNGTGGRLVAEAIIADSTVSDNTVEELLTTQLNGGLAILSASRNTISNEQSVAADLLSVHATVGTDAALDNNCLSGRAEPDAGAQIRTFGNNTCRGDVSGPGTVFHATPY